GVEFAADGTLGSRVLLASEDYETVAAAWSPEGSRLVMLGFSPATGLYNLYLCTLDGLPPRQLLTSHSRVNPPVWSADGREIIYDVQEEGARHLYRLNPEDGRGGMIVTEDDWNAYPIPSPDGSYLAYLSDTSGFVNLYSLDLNQNNTQPQILTLVTPDVGYVWSPEIEQRRIAFINAADNDLYWTVIPNFQTAIPFPSFRLTDNDDYNVILK
ncbi:MAG: PD40 domain-containing protein, partial [Chitinophagaceae bacterium]|nr:PD40 domain-containing protein [Anaerolineae bacterium]